MFLRSYLSKVWKQNIRDVEREELGEKNTIMEMILVIWADRIKDEYINSGDGFMRNE